VIFIFSIKKVKLSFPPVIMIKPGILVTWIKQFSEKPVTNKYIYKSMAVLFSLFNTISNINSLLYLSKNIHIFTQKQKKCTFFVNVQCVNREMLSMVVTAFYLKLNSNGSQC